MKTKLIPADGAAESLQLCRAILLYANGSDALATVHEILEGEDGPSLLPGVPMNQVALSDLVSTLHENTSRFVLPERVLFADATLLMWWCPASRREIYFKSGKSELDELSGKLACHPPLVFLASAQSLAVWALTDNLRPVADTALYAAPYFNIYESGNMCSGNVRLPESLSPSNKNLKAWESAFFETNFTHSNRGGALLTAFEGGHNALWQAMTSPDVSEFPSSALAPTIPPVSVGKVLGMGATL